MQYRLNFAVSTLLFIGMVCCTSCRPEGTSSSGYNISIGTVHPVNKLISTEGTSTTGSILSKEITSGNGFERAGLNKLVTIGKEDGDINEVLGRVSDVKIGVDNYIYILDSGYNTVKSFDLEGNYIGKFGGPGVGPEEFRAPVSLDIDSSGDMIVLDRDRRIKVYRYHEEEANTAYKLYDTFISDINPEGFCTIGEYIYIQGQDENDVGSIHIYNKQTGKRVDSFGYTYPSSNILVRDVLTEGAGIMCDPVNNLVVATYTYSPYVFGYTTSGELVWRSTIDGFKPGKVTEEVSDVGTPQVTRHTMDQGVQIPASLVLLNNNKELLLQVREIIGSGEDRSVKMNSYIVSLLDGSGYSIGDHLPFILSIKNDLAVSAEHSPFPVVSVNELELAN